jgi:hypothetical protein
MSTLVTHKILVNSQNIINIRQEIDMQSDFRKYRAHKDNAKKRNVPFLLSFEEWWDIWQKSGHYDERGNKKGQYCMSRYNDIGAYQLGNVFIQLHSDNVTQAWSGKKHSHEAKEKISTNHIGMLGKTQSQETKEKIGLAHKGKIVSEETRMKQRLAKLGTKRGSYSKKVEV